jgi:FtsP/CotA-like multicopper oxidase with cupredoxin domain
MFTRRRLCEAAALLAGAGAVSGRAQAAAIPEAPTTRTNTMQPPLVPASGPHYQPVVTLNGWTLPWRMNGDWKEFHLVAEPVEREFAPGMTVHLWGYSGQSPGPTIECVEGDKVRIFVTNKLPEHTSVHWHGMLLPNGMDGVGGLTQPHIEPGKTFVYEFQLKASGTFMYHPHSDEMVQMGMGMMGMFIVHPRDENFRRVDRDFVFLRHRSRHRAAARFRDDRFQHVDLEQPGLSRHRPAAGAAWRQSARAHGQPHHDQSSDASARLSLRGDRHRGGWVPESAQWPHATVDVPVGEIRAIDFIADNPGDWAFHCHKSHHTMNAMGHNTRNLIGAKQKQLTRAIRNVVPDYMPMGSTGMAEMGAMEMPLPDNTLPMMTGFGQFGPLEMGGMFTVVKVREDLAVGDYKDPGPYKFPPGSVAYEFNGDAGTAPRQSEPAASSPHKHH